VFTLCIALYKLFTRCFSAVAELLGGNNRLKEAGKLFIMSYVISMFTYLLASVLILCVMNGLSKKSHEFCDVSPVKSMTQNIQHVPIQTK